MHDKREDGQAILLVILALGIFLIGTVGLAIDGANLFAQRQMAQTAADASAQAAVLSVFHGTNVTGAHPFATTTPASSYNCTPTDGTTPCAYARLNGFGTTNSDTVAVAFPTTVSGVTTLSSGSVPAVSITISRPVATTLMRFFGTTSTTIDAIATAALLQTSLANCMTSLSGSGTGFSASGNTSLTLNSCGIADNSNFSANGNVTITANAIDVAGSVSEAGNVNITPAPAPNGQRVGDPLGNVTAPAFNATSSCTVTGQSYSGTTVLSRATYCGGTSISGNANITFNPGTYIFRGGLSIGGNATVTFGAK